MKIAQIANDEKSRENNKLHHINRSTQWQKRQESVLFALLVKIYLKWLWAYRKEQFLNIIAMRLLRLLLIASVVLYVCEPHSGINDFEYFFLLFFLSFVECRFWKYQEWSYRRRILFLLLLLLFAIHIFHFFEIHPYIHSGMYMYCIYTCYTTIYTYYAYFSLLFGFLLVMFKHDAIFAFIDTIRRNKEIGIAA